MGWMTAGTGARPQAVEATGQASLSDRELQAVISLVHQKSGITLHDGKRTLVTARLHKRLTALGFTTFSDYLEYVRRDRSGNELVMLLDAIATNHTSFFRESQHFDFLRTEVLPEWRTRRGNLGGGLDVWSAACSSGEEPFTLAITLRDALADPLWARVRILASDLSTKVLKQAQSAVYKIERVQDLPIELLRRHFEKGRGEQEGLARVNLELRRAVEFRQLNLLEIDDLQRRFAVIFCRNVMIYFDRGVQQRVVAMLERHLAPGGFLFISHSESLNGVKHNLKWVAPAVYRRRDE